MIEASEATSGRPSTASSEYILAACMHAGSAIYEIDCRGHVEQALEPRCVRFFDSATEGHLAYGIDVLCVTEPSDGDPPRPPLDDYLGEDTDEAVSGSDQANGVPLVAERLGPGIEGEGVMAPIHKEQGSAGREFTLASCSFYDNSICIWRATFPPM